MKKLFFSLVLGTIIAICWVMIIHTLKWIAIRGNEFEFTTMSQQQQQQSRPLAGGAGNLGGEPPPGANYLKGNLLVLPVERPTLEELLLVTSPKAASLSERRRVKDDNKLSPPPKQVRNVASPAIAWPPPPVAAAPQSLRQIQKKSEKEEEEEEEDTKKETTRGDKKTRLVRRQLVGSGSLNGFGLDDNDNDDDSSNSDRFALQATAPTSQMPPPPRIAASISRSLPPSTSEQLKQAANERQVPQKRLMHLSSIVTQDANQSAQKQQQHRQQPIMPPPPPTSDSIDRGAEDEPLRSDASQDSNARSEISDNSAPPPPAVAAASSDVAAADEVDSSGWPSPPAAGSQLERGAPVAGLAYRAPFFTSWFVSIWNILFMPIFTLISSCCFRNEDSSTKKLLVESISQFMDNGLTTLQFLGRCAFFSVLWIGTIFGIVYSLSNIDATVVMALFACSAALVYLLSWVLLHQQFVGVRIVAVIICTTGIALLAYMDNSRTLGSVLIVAGSALCSAVYKVIYQRMFGFWSIAQMSLFFTLIGLFNAFLMWPVALLLYFLGVELIVWRYIPWMHLTAAGALHLTANIVAYFGPICSYDIFLTMGLLLAVVLSAVIDVTFYKITFFGMKLAGVLLLMIGFLVCLLPENWNEFLYDLVNERFVRWKKQRSLKKSRNKVQDLSTGQMSRLRTPSGRVK